MRQFVVETPRGPAHWTTMEAGEIPQVVEKHAGNRAMFRFNDEWCGGSFASLRHCAELGDESLVEKADAFLAQLEDQVPVTRGWRSVDDVVGAVPNVPAFLAGHPQHMRRRERAARDNAPLTLFLDLTSSAVIDADTVQRRAVVLLALVRLLVEHRPVALWAGVGQDVGMRGAGYVAWRIDTAPLDLARAAYHVGAANMARRFGYGVNTVCNGAGGHWPHHDPSHTATHGEHDLRAVFETDMLVVPALQYNDPAVRDPVGWLKAKMAKYVRQEEN